MRKGHKIPFLPCRMHGVITHRTKRVRSRWCAKVPEKEKGNLLERYKHLGKKMSLLKKNKIYPKYTSKATYRSN